MSKPHLFRGALCGLAATLSVAACSSSNQADPFNGEVFTTDYTCVSPTAGQTCNPAAWDAKFLASDTSALCKNAVNAALTLPYPCYPAQLGYAQGNQVWFYNFAATGLKYSTLPNPIPVSAADPATLGGGGAHVDLFAHGSCTPAPTYDPRLNPYTTTAQFPVWNNLPFATSAFGAIVYPIVATYSVTLSSPETCNDIKDSRSITDATGGGGDDGAIRSAHPTGYSLYAAIDPNAAVNAQLPGQLNPNWGPNWGWYKGELLRYFDGGPIPTKAVTNPDGSAGKAFVAMEGIILDGASFANVTDQKVILLPYPPGDPNYSPIVNLHDYTLQAGQSLGQVTSICQPGTSPCPITSADFTKAKATPFYTIFIASTAQQTN